MEPLLWSIIGLVGGVTVILGIFAAVALIRAPYRD
jgi:hypothetical protein